MYFPFWFKSGIWLLIEPVPVHCFCINFICMASFIKIHVQVTELWGTFYNFWITPCRNGRTDEWKNENYIPVGINAGGIMMFIYMNIALGQRKQLLLVDFIS